LMNVNVTEDISVKGRVMAALTRMDEVERRVAIRRLRNENRRATIDACLSSLDNADESVRISAAKTLPIVGSTPDVASKLIDLLRTNPTPQVRCACAKELARAESPEAADAVLASLDDSNDEVVMASCQYLARWGGRPAIEALLQLLSHPTWDVRLRASIALVDLGVCNARVLSTLESLAGAPEARVHDARVAAFDEAVEETGGLLPMHERIGTIREIVDRARRVHTRSVRMAA